MSVAGLRIDAPSAANSGAGITFFTNAILCLKQGGMQAAVDPVWFANCGKLFLRPTIELIAPNAVVTLGERAYRAVCCYLSTIAELGYLMHTDLCRFRSETGFA